MFRTLNLFICALLALMLLAACQTATPAATGTASIRPTVTLGPQILLPSGGVTATGGSSATAASTPAETPFETQSVETPEPSATGENWIIDVNDTQDVTQKKGGMVFHCTLTVHATKDGGADATGDYRGQILLKVELDTEALAALMEEDGLTLDSSTYNYQLQAEDTAFTVQKFSKQGYADGMKLILPDNPLLAFAPQDNYDAMVLQNITMTSTMDASSISGHDEYGQEGSGSAPGLTAMVSTPVVMTIAGNAVYVSLPGKSGGAGLHFDRDFKGKVTHSAQ